MHPDEFFILVDDSVGSLVREATKAQMDYWCAKRGEALLPDYLERAKCPDFAQRVRRHQAIIGGTPFIERRG